MSSQLSITDLIVVSPLNIVVVAVMTMKIMYVYFTIAVLLVTRLSCMI